MRIRLFALIGFVLLLAGCKSAPLATLNPPTAAPATSAPLATQPVVENTALPPTALPLPDLPTPQRGPLRQPAVIARYPLVPGVFGESLAASPGRIWVGTTFGTLEAHDATTGTLLQIVPLIDTSVDGLAPVKDLAFDGKHLWAVVSWENGSFTQMTEIFVLDAASGKVLRRLDQSDQEPAYLGVSPGLVWSQYQMFHTNLPDTDPAAFQPEAIDMTTDSTVFGYDGDGWMWAGGSSACDTCKTSLYRFGPQSILPGPNASDPVQRIIPAGARMWVISSENRMDAYDPLGPLGVDDAPTARQDLSQQMEVPPVGGAYDGKSLWLLSGAGNGGGTLYQYDPLSGQLLFHVVVGDWQGERMAHIPAGVIFDGHDLWVLTSLDLVRVGLPPGK